MENSVRERIMSYIRYKNISVRAFEKTCGLSNGYVRSIEQTIMPAKIKTISLNFPELNIGWLLTGEGEMLRGAPAATLAEQAVTVLLLPVSAQGGSLNDFVLSVREDDCEKVISPVRGVDFAMQVTGDSMAPEYPNGSRIFIKRINEKAFIEWGKTYVLDTCNGSVIKRIVPSENKGFIKCVSINTDPIYAPFEVSMSDIYGIYKVLLCMSVK